jgi:hypothetical protein
MDCLEHNAGGVQSHQREIAFMAFEFFDIINPRAKKHWMSNINMSSGTRNANSVSIFFVPSAQRTRSFAGIRK